MFLASRRYVGPFASNAPWFGTEPPMYPTVFRRSGAVVSGNLRQQASWLGPLLHVRAGASCQPHETARQITELSASRFLFDLIF
jgi:hypothetical protein